MKRTGDYTLILPKTIGEKEDSRRKITSIEWSKGIGGTVGRKPFYTFTIKTKSPNGEFYDLHIGGIHNFSLINNNTGKATNYYANKQSA